MNAEELKIIIRAEIGQFRQEIEDAIREIESVEETSKKSFGEFNDEVQKAGDVSKKVFAGIVGAITGAAVALLALGASTKEYREGQAKLNTAFEDAGAAAEVAKGVYNDLYRVLGDDQQAVEAASHLAKLTTNQKELEQWTKITQGVYATFGDSLPIESLTEAANETAKTGELTGALADALNWAGIAEDDFKARLLECNTEAEREALIRETLSGLYGDAAELYEENAAGVIAQNEAQLKLNESTAKIGELMAPVQAKLTELAATLLEKVAPALTEFIDKYGPDIEKTLTKVAEAIGKVLSWVIDNWELVSTLAIVIAAISAALTVFSTVMAIVNAVMMASPVTWIVLAIVAAIAALIAIIVLCVKHWDEIKGAAEKAWNKIKEVWNSVANWFSSKVVEPIKNFFSGLWNSVTNGFNKAKDTVLGVFDKIKSGISNKINSAKEVVSSAINKIKGFFNFKWSLPKIKTPSLSISWSQSPKWMAEAAKLVGLQGVPKFSVSWNALGGVFDKPTIFGYGNSLQGIGEAGAEAVVPLENNLEWLDKLAGMLDARLNNRQNITLKVDKRVLGQVAAEGINDITKLTGNIPLRFS